MEIVIDEKIPFIGEALEKMGHTVCMLPGDVISKEHLVGAEALFVRTRTFCNAALLDGTAVRFIGTATIGYDHIDTVYCKENGIVWSNAPGCNADAVLQYVQSVIYIWARERGRGVCGLTLGVVGVGQIGSRVARWAESVGMRVLLNDPPREENGDKGFVSLDAIAAECDIITFHPALSRCGKYPSYHLADYAFLHSLSRCSLLINASRGPVVDNEALLQLLRSGGAPDVVLDVWEGEPDINLELLDKTYIATPHIAGYSAEGKLNASRIVLDAFARFSLYSGSLPLSCLPLPDEQTVLARTMPEALLAIYNPLNDSERLKSAPGSFESLRNNYRLRREPKSFEIITEK